MPKTRRQKRSRFTTSNMEGSETGMAEMSSCVPDSDLTCFSALRGLISRMMRASRVMSDPENADTGTRIHDMMTIRQSKRFQSSAKYPDMISGSSSSSRGGLKPKPKAMSLRNISAVKMPRMIQSAIVDVFAKFASPSRETHVSSNAMMTVFAKIAP